VLVALQTVLSYRYSSSDQSQASLNYTNVQWHGILISERQWLVTSSIFHQRTSWNAEKYACTGEKEVKREMENIL
jgi:hypothetical protein